MTVQEFIRLSKRTQRLLLSRPKFETNRDTVRDVYPEFNARQVEILAGKSWPKHVQHAFTHLDYDVGAFARALITVEASHRISKALDKLDKAKTQKAEDAAVRELKRWEAFKPSMPVSSVAARTVEAETPTTLDPDDIELGFTHRKPQLELRGARSFDPETGHFNGKADEWGTAVPAEEPNSDGREEPN